MTVSVQTPFGGQVANGATTVFPFAYQVLQASDLVVQVDGLPPGAYTLTGIGSPTGGSIVFAIAPANGARVLHFRRTPLSRQTDYQSSGDFLAPVVNADFDRIWLALQDSTAVIGARSVRAPIGEILADMPSSQNRVNKVLSFDALGNPITVVPVSGSAINLAIDLADFTQATNGAGQVGYSQTVTYPANTVGAAFQAAGGVADVAALRTQAKGANRRVTTRHYNAASPEYEGGAEYVCDLADVSSVDNGGTVIVGADGGRWKLQVRGDMLIGRQCGLTGNGVTGESARLIAVDAMARALKKTLFIEGTPLLDLQIVLTNPTSWKFAGHSNNLNTLTGVSAATLPAAWLKVGATQPMSTSAVVVAHPGIVFNGGGIGCATKGLWPYDGITIAANAFRWENAPGVWYMGRDGFRIGNDTGVFNSNSVFLDNPSSCWNMRHGINISDDDGSKDANTFLILAPKCLNNFGHGIRFGKTFLGGTVITPTIEQNTIGMYFETDAEGIVIIGGDIEANEGPIIGPVTALLNVVHAGAATKFRNFLLGTTVVDTPGVATPVGHPFAFGGVFTPLITGATTGGTVAYTQQKGVYTLSNGVLEVNIHVAWNSHTGTGQMYCSLPDLTGLQPTTTWGVSVPNFIQAGVTSASLSVAAGASLAGLVTTNTIPPRVQFYLQNAGALSSQGVIAAGELYINASIPLFKF